MRVLLLTGLLLTAIGVGAVLGTRRHAAAASPAQPAPALTVTSTVPRHALWPLTFDASGSVAPWQEESVGAQIGGYRLTKVLVNVGDHVRKGQLLAQLDPALLQADEVQLKASADQADANHERALELKSSGAISDQDVLQFVTQAKTADAALASKRLQLRYTAVIAPDDGTVSSRTATLGAVASVGQELFRLIRQDRIEWRGELTADQLARVAVGQKIILSLPDATTAIANVRETSPELDLQTRMAIVYADIKSGSRARAGMYANGHVALGQSDALIVPAVSVVIRDGRSYVLKVMDRSAEPKVSLQPVMVGRRLGDDVEIVSGLGDADRVIVQGAGFLNDGDVVRLVDTSTPSLQPGAQGMLP